MGGFFYNKNISYEILTYLNNKYKNIKIISNNLSFSKIILKCKRKNKIYVLKLFLKGRKDESLIFDNIKEKSKYIMYHLDKIKINNDIILIYKYYEKGDLFSFINNSIIIRYNFKIKIIKQLVELLIFLKKYNIVHIDLKTENILLDDCYNIKVIDFEHSEVIKNENGINLKIKGTYNYLPPESIYRNKYSFKNDYWSLGIIIFILFTKKNFYLNTYKNILKEKKINKEIVHLISNLLNPFFNERYDIYDLKKNKVINSNSFFIKYFNCINLFKKRDKIYNKL